jgi:hypothetical protein
MHEDQDLPQGPNEQFPSPMKANALLVGQRHKAAD